MAAPHLSTAINNGFEFKRTQAVDFYNKELVEEQLIKFKKNRLVGKISSEHIKEDGTRFLEFEENTWKLTGYSNPILIHFRVANVKRYQRYLESRISINEFICFLKLFFLINYDEHTYPTLVDRIRDLVKDVDRSCYFTEKISFPTKERATAYKLFCSYLPICIEEHIVEESADIIDDVDKKRNDRAECLCEFISYFILDDELERFWTVVATEREKQYFAPFYLHWRLTTILPMRPLEFTVTPLDCISKENGKYYFLRMYSRIKGHDYDIKVYHDLRDFEREKIEIPEDLALEFLKYKEKRMKYEGNGFLFSTEIMKDNYPSNANVTYSEFFTPDHMIQIKNRFYDYLESRRGYKIIEKKDVNEMNSDIHSVPNKVIMRMQCRDTRHIAMINLLKNGCSTKMLMKIAHHEKPETSLHYAENVDQLEDAAFYVYYSRDIERIREIKVNGEASPVVNYVSQGQIKYRVAREKMDNKNQGNRIDMGYVWCYSSKRISGDWGDCIKNFSLDEGLPCRICKFKEIKDEYREEFQTNVHNEMKNVLNDLLNCFPVSDDKTMLDISHYLHELNKITNIQRSELVG